MADSFLQIEQRGPARVVGFPPDAELDAVTMDQVSRELFALIEAERPPKVIIDFANLRFLSSQAIGVLLTVRLKAARTGAEVVLTRVSPEFHDIFALTNFQNLYLIFGTVEEALDHFGATAKG